MIDIAFLFLAACGIGTVLFIVLAMINSIDDDEDFYD